MHLFLKEKQLEYSKDIIIEPQYNSTTEEITIFTHCTLHLISKEIRQPYCTKQDFNISVKELLFMHGIKKIFVEKDNGQSVTTQMYKANRK